MTQKRATSSTNGVETIDEVELSFGKRGRFPSELSGRDRCSRRGTEIAHKSCVGRLTGMKRLMRYGWLDPI